MTAKLVSAVVPTNRVNDQLFEALESLDSQTYPAVEVVLVLDGVALTSTPTMARHHLKVVRLPESAGTPRALNAGLAAASGEYIARLDADDRAAPGRIARQVEFLDAHKGVVALGTAHRLITSDGRHIGNGPTAVGDLRRALLRRNPLVHSSMLFRASTLREVGGYNPRCTRMQDYELYLRVAQLGEISTLPDILTEYRVHGGQNSKNSPVFSYSTGAIIRERFRLAKVLGVGPISVSVHSVAWLVWQSLRQLGLVRPKYLSGVHRASHKAATFGED